MKKLSILTIAIILATSCCAYAAKYTVNSSGVVKSQGKVISCPANTVNQNYYNNFNAQSYVSSNQVNDIQVGTIEIVMDYSGSMSNWIGVAKRSMSAIVAQIPSSVKLGFRVFGHDLNGTNPVGSTVQQVKQIIKKGNGKFNVVTGTTSTLGKTTGACAATRQVTGLMPASANSLIMGMNSVNVGGMTPLVYALDRTVYQDFAGMDLTTPKKIVLITDGYENCGGDPCAFARELMSKRSDIHIDVVLVSSNSRRLACLTQTTGGHFYTVDNLSDFSSVMTQTLNSMPSNQPPLSNPQDINPSGQNYEFIKFEDDLY